MKKTLIILLFCVIILPLKAQIAENTENKSCKFQRENLNLGFAAGWTTGYGISGRYWMKNLGLQLTFTPYMEGSDYQISSGFTFLYMLDRNKFINLFAYQGNHYWVDKWTSWNGNETHKREFWNNGLGLGLEFIIGRRASFNLMGGYARYGEGPMIFMTGETGLFYKF